MKNIKLWFYIYFYYVVLFYFCYSSLNKIVVSPKDLKYFLDNLFLDCLPRTDTITDIFIIFSPITLLQLEALELA